jgi:beta-glucuronidase
MTLKTIIKLGHPLKYKLMNFKIELLAILFILSGIGIQAQNFKTANPKDIALFPQQNDCRNVLNLSGIWKFKKDSMHVGEKEQWFNGLKNYRSIAVPGSWNEQFADSRDYLDYVWYETETYIPSNWKGQNIFLRVGSAVYSAQIWINGVPVGQHEGGHLPFAFDVNSVIKWNAKNRISIRIENLMQTYRVPTGNVVGGQFANFPASNYDFFPYAGLHRPVWLYSVPAIASIRDITVRTNFQGTTGLMDIKVEQKGSISKGKVLITGENTNIEYPITFKNGVANASIKIPNVRLWSNEDPYLYSVVVTIGDGVIKDRYSLETGVRTVSADKKHILLNGKPIFLKGFGKHEDFPIFGRGSAYPVIIKDFSLLKWVGANSFRTSHYPYDEEYYNIADREGILIIDEIPAVGLFFDGDSTEVNIRQERCRTYIDELYNRDKNHPSVITWCVANEPSSNAKIGTGAEDNTSTLKGYKYLNELIQKFKTLDNTRLAIYVAVMAGPRDWLELSDITCINRYWGWYTNTGDLKGAVQILSGEMDRYYKSIQKPVMVTEFGADTYPGMHSEQNDMYTEDFQRDFIKAYLDVADSKDYVTGMHVWNFADFKTSQNLIRFGGYNFKGVFTRDRKPKAAAYYLRSRWNKDTQK